MPDQPSVKSGTPSKNAENQDAATLTESQPSTSEEVQARAGQPSTRSDQESDGSRLTKDR